VPTYWYGTAVRNRDGTLTYTKRGSADSGQFDLGTSSLTLKVSVAKLNALQTRGVIGSKTVLLGLRGSAAVTTAAANPISDSTRGGRTFTIQNCSAF
jgi:hypothetical protein